MSKKLIALMLGFTLLIGGCNLWGNPDDEVWVVTSVTQVKDECVEGSLPIDLSRVAPKLKEQFPNEEFILSRKDCLKDGAIYAPVSTDSGEWTGDVVRGTLESLLAGLKVFFPGLAGLEALLLILFPRKRTHYASAAKSLATLNVKNTLINLGKALGAAHSSEGTKEVFIEEKLEEKESKAATTRRSKRPIRP